MSNFVAFIESATDSLIQNDGNIEKATLCQMAYELGEYYTIIQNWEKALYNFYRCESIQLQNRNENSEWM